MITIYQLHGTDLNNSWRYVSMYKVSGGYEILYSDYLPSIINGIINHRWDFMILDVDDPKFQKLIKEHFLLNQFASIEQFNSEYVEYMI